MNKNKNGKIETKNDADNERQLELKAIIKENYGETINQLLHKYDIEHDHKNNRIYVDVKCTREKLMQYNMSKLGDAEDRNEIKIRANTTLKHEKIEIDTRGNVKLDESFDIKDLFEKTIKTDCIDLDVIFDMKIENDKKIEHVKKQAEVVKQEYKDRFGRIKKQVEEIDRGLKLNEYSSSYNICIYLRNFSYDSELFETTHSTRNGKKRYDYDFNILDNLDIEELEKEVQRLRKIEKEKQKEKEREDEKKREAQKTVNDIKLKERIKNRINKDEIIEKGKEEFFECFELTEKEVEALKKLKKYSERSTTNKPFIEIMVKLDLDAIKEIRIYNHVKNKEIYDEEQEKDYYNDANFNDEEYAIADAVADVFEDAVIYISSNYNEKYSYLNVKINNMYTVEIASREMREAYY